MEAARREVLLGAEEVAERCGISVDLARDVMARLPHVRIGMGKRQLVKIRERVLERWIERGGDETWQRSTCAEQHGGPGDTIETGGGGVEQPIKPKSELRGLSQPRSSKNSRLTPITPATKASRLSKRSN
jgi:hypothetical protein